MTVLVAHPARQHAHRLAQALQSAGLLHSYWTLLPDRRALAWLPTGLDALLPSAVLRNSLQFLPGDKVHVLLGPLLIQKIASKHHSVALRQWGEWMAWAALDRWVARQLPRLRPKLVVGYEMCCAETFRVAKTLGITCVLDAAACHHALQDKVLDEDKYGAKTWAGQQLRLRKKLEIDLADKIICVSELARHSYIDAGVDGQRIAVNQVGCDTAKFKPSGEMLRSGVPKFVFVGVPVFHKGFDCLSASYAALLDAYPEAELHVAGDATMVDGLLGCKNVHFHGKLSHEQLSLLLAKMDCLILPSRLESFGMVVVEALATGLPVILSDHVGAAEVVTEDKNGWVIPAGDQAALLQRMLTCCREIERLRAMQDACTRSAAGYDWSHYSRRAVEIFKPLLTGSV